MALFQKFSENFQGLSKSSGLKKWRFKGTKLAVQAQSIIGTFHEEECYMMIETNSRYRIDVERHVYLWIGSKVPQKTEMNLLHMISTAVDKYIQNVTNISKQKQEKETRDFLDMFPRGIKYLHGAYETCLHFQNGKYLKRLFQIKGKRNIIIKQVTLHSNSLNQGDSFVLEDEWCIYIWNGNKSSKVERIKAIEVAQSIRDDLCYGKAEIVVADSGVDRTAEKNFFNMLGSHGTIKSTSVNEVKHTSGLKQQQEVVIYRMCENHGTVQLQKIDVESELEKKVLNSQYCYIIYQGKIVYVWCGHDSDEFINRKVLTTAQNFITDTKTDEATPIVSMKESYETEELIKLFLKWPVKTISVENGKVAIREADSNIDKIDGSKMMKDEMIDDASGTIKIWCISGHESMEWPAEHYGIFYENESYVILYTNHEFNTSIIYIWQGIMSNEEDREHTMHFAQRLDDSLFQGRSTQIHVVFGEEPAHFLQILKGKFTVMMEKASNEENIKFYQISGSNGSNTKIIQIPPLCAFLDSDDVFLLKLNDKTMIWEGIFTNDIQKDFAEMKADQISPNGDLLIFEEGYEPREFWLALGGRNEYNIEEKKIKEYSQPRLYHCSDKTGEFLIDEITPFDQDDLNSDDVMILDTTEEVYIWIGEGANEIEKTEAWRYVKDYLAACNDGRSFEQTCIIQVKQGREPNSFAYLFENWDDKKAKNYMPYEVYKSQVAHENKEAKDKELVRPIKNQTSRGEQRILRRSFYLNEHKKKDKQFLKRFLNLEGF